MNETEKNNFTGGPRIKPLPVNEMQASWVKTLERLPGAALKGRFSPVNVFGTLMHEPSSMGSFLEYWVTSKLEMSLTPREQELIILRMGYLYKCNYVWKHHYPVAREYGATDAELEAVKKSPLPTVFNAREYALLMLTEEMAEHHTIRDGAWTKWGSQLKEAEMIDLISIVSQYTFFTLLNNSLQIEVEKPLEEVPGL